MGRLKRFFFISLAFTMGLALTACGNGSKEVVQPTPEEPIMEEPVEEDIIPEFKYTFPLTGVGTDEEVDVRPYAVTINNHPSARPQSGLFQADIVYEVLAEGEITRFVAIFQSQKPENIGPVRSARGYFIDLANGYDAFFITHGWSPEAQVMLERERRADYLSGLKWDGTYFKRSSERKAPHNSYITYENVVSGLEREGYSLEGTVQPLAFMKEEDFGVTGETAKNVSINYYNRYEASYEYSKEEEQYKRYTAGKQLLDHETEKPVLAKNVLIVEMEHRVVDDVGRRSINLTSGGEALLLQNGVAQKVEWINKDGRILPIKNGEVLDLLPGSTWINIIPTSPGLEASVEISE